ncbi:GAF domain-containing protein [Achromobacter seleniivolatilans]|uniref:GAF domain-containing protein n=1 Tax=Achromobacter seleniivolatilans TaxID=3047478 RepID=A0ABY9M7F1_9BURK|nr:GAF domain-containing protein [Achromobacter sp. R39]WMD22123.1 GAF domain-containing protein [Achromobacter sp. R39]
MNLLFTLSPPEIETLTAALSCARKPGTPDPLLRALDELAQLRVGHRLFTALRYDLAAGMAHRLYSSAPQIYAANGSKRIVDAPALHRMVTSGQPMLTADADAVRKNFPDADAIFSLNCESVLNIPVYGRGQLLGQINLLHASDYYSPAHIKFCEGLAIIAAPAFIACDPSHA